MKLTIILALLVGVVSAIPVAVESSDSPTEAKVHVLQSVQELEALQAAQVANARLLSRNELEDGDPSQCPRAILIFARGSLELSNMVSTHLPSLIQSVNLT